MDEVLQLLRCVLVLGQGLKVSGVDFAISIGLGLPDLIRKVGQAEFDADWLVCFLSRISILLWLRARLLLVLYLLGASCLLHVSLYLPGYLRRLVG